MLGYCRICESDFRDKPVAAIASDGWHMLRNGSAARYVQLENGHRVPLSFLCPAHAGADYQRLLDWVNACGYDFQERTTWAALQVVQAAIALGISADDFLQNPPLTPRAVDEMLGREPE